MSQIPGATQPESPGEGLAAIACRAAAGLDTGFTGAVAVLIWFAASSVLGGGPWFSRFNLAAGPFYGDLVFASGPGWHTVAGAAHLLLIYSLLGAAYGLLPASREGWLNLMTALGYAGLIHLCADAWLWKRFHPFAHPYFAPLAVAPGHLLYGLFLWRFPSRLARIASLLGSQDAIAALVPAPQEPQIQCVTEAGASAEPAAETPETIEDPAAEPSPEAPFIPASGAPERPDPPVSPESNTPDSLPDDGSPPPSSLE